MLKSLLFVSHLASVWILNLLSTLIISWQSYLNNSRDPSKFLVMNLSATALSLSMWNINHSFDRITKVILSCHCLVMIYQIWVSIFFSIYIWSMDNKYPCLFLPYTLTLPCFFYWWTPQCFLVMYRQRGPIMAKCQSLVVTFNPSTFIFCTTSFGP